MAHIGQSAAASSLRELREYGYVNPNEVFPRHVMQQVDFGITRGIEVRVTQYAVAEGLPGEGSLVGAIMSLYLKAPYKEAGHYAVRYL